MAYSVMLILQFVSVVLNSVLLNWEIEFKRFCPSFKVLTYYGSRQYRLSLRKGWNTENRFHVCITSYNLILSDATVFRRKKWHYMILDEAQYIKVASPPAAFFKKLISGVYSRPIHAI